MVGGGTEHASFAVWEKVETSAMLLPSTSLKALWVIANTHVIKPVSFQRLLQRASRRLARATGGSLGQYENEGGMK